MFLYFSLIFTLSFNDLPIVSYNDFTNPSTFLIYLYYNKPEYDCPLCTQFNNKISELQMNIKRLNFYEDPLLSSHFYVYEFPSFIIRHNLKSYRIQVSTIEELFNIIDNKKWVTIKPMFFNPDNFITKIYAYFYLIFYYCVEYISGYIENIPLWVINGIMTFVLCYLVMSVIGVFKNK